MELWGFPLQASSAWGNAEIPTPRGPLAVETAHLAWLRTLSLLEPCLELLCSTGVQVFQVFHLWNRKVAHWAGGYPEGLRGF